MLFFARAFTGTEAEDAATVAGGFGAKVRAAAGKVPFVVDAVALYYCARDPATPSRVKAGAFAALAYFVVALDLVPDAVPALGFVDDAAVVAHAVAAARQHVTDAHRARARAALAGPDPVL